MKQYEQVTKYKKVFKEAKDLPIEEINKQWLSFRSINWFIIKSFLLEKK